jgi:hypothetical protein
MVEKRFPRLSRLVDDGLLDEREKLVLERKIAEARGTNLPEHDVSGD